MGLDSSSPMMKSSSLVKADWPEPVLAVLGANCAGVAYAFGANSAVEAGGVGESDDGDLLEAGLAGIGWPRAAIGDWLGVCACAEGRMLAVAGGGMFVRAGCAVREVPGPLLSRAFLVLLVSSVFEASDVLPSSAPYFSNSCCVVSYLVACLNLFMAWRRCCSRFLMCVLLLAMR